jgi:hypothetical protein
VAWFVGGAGNRYAVCGSHADGHGSVLGAIAQLVERLHGMQEVRSSNLLSSTPWVFPQVKSLRWALMIVQTQAGCCGIPGYDLLYPLVSRML